VAQVLEYLLKRHKAILWHGSTRNDISDSCASGNPFAERVCALWGWVTSDRHVGQILAAIDKCRTNDPE
jgi:hypothetical protein